MRKTRLGRGEHIQTCLPRVLAAAGCVGLFLPHSVLSQEPESAVDPVEIIEQSVSSQPSSSTPRPPQDANNLSALFYELQLMQNEVMKLRGEFEELGHRIDELSRQQSAQYTDIDRRLRGLPPATTELPENLQDGGMNEGADPAPSTQESMVSQPATEEDAYRQSFELIEGHQFEQAVDAFDQFLIDYPNGEYTPNAFYWLGELHLRLDDLEKSRQSFVQVLTLFPDNRKVPDALYKLGIVYDRLGDGETAERYLRRILSEHPTTTAAGLSREYLRQR